MNVATLRRRSRAGVTCEGNLGPREVVSHRDILKGVLAEPARVFEMHLPVTTPSVEEVADVERSGGRQHESSSWTQVPPSTPEKTI